MVLYECHICSFSSPRRYNYDAHLRSRKHNRKKNECLHGIQNTENEIKEVDECDTELIIADEDNAEIYCCPPTQYKGVIMDDKNEVLDNHSCADLFYDEECTENTTLYCTYCGKLFKHKSSRSRHEKQNCPHNEKIPYSRLVDLLNNKNEMIMKIDGENKNYDNKVNDLKNRIRSLVQKIENIESGNNKNIHYSSESSNNINAVLNINNYHQTNYEFLTKFDFMKCIRDCNKCVQRLVERVHFNPNRPENMNIFVSSYQGKFLMIYRNGKWIMRPKKSEVDTLFEEKELILENWLDEFGSSYPDLVHKYKRYLNNKNNAGEKFINELKEEIVMVLYNNRDMVLKHVCGDGKSIPLIKSLK